ncbi:hypothetical protein EYC80_004301 [Monilinia laxa]|uniref:Uncharacterized protein n=1 Tax=Monilinia laxa TaxID=61186 RepID=A0A5N6KMU7_MONLA|nr:hypothetical protein EYC80_004301 [Monilinia laxa]
MNKQINIHTSIYIHISINTDSTLKQSTSTTMCRSITYRYRICMHSWRPYVVLCGKPTADATGKCPFYKVRFERRVIGSGNGYCAGCWAGLMERERVLEGNMRRRVEEMRRGRAVEEERVSLLGVGGRDVGRRRMEGEDGMRWILERERQRRENSEDLEKKNEEQRGKEMKERKDTKRSWTRKKEEPEFYIV